VVKFENLFCYALSHLFVTMMSEITEYSHLVYYALSQSHALPQWMASTARKVNYAGIVFKCCAYTVNEAHGIKVGQAFIHQAWPQAERSNKTDIIYLDISSHICLKCSRASLPCPWIGKS
jgi:hypothetical protein